ncbi:ATP-binding cassette domain-containing protein, partial [Helicobacter pylori]|uniref:ATP-binding cassette domain-containing protein n=1 Tax=Helicobacter pylori TaxID=210 RepID=UPI0009945A35
HPKTMFKNALNIQDFSFKSHTSTAIIGTNGAGKSTLINTILGIDQTIILKHKTIIFHTTTMLYHNASNWELSLTYSTTHLD